MAFAELVPHLVLRTRVQFLPGGWHAGDGKLWFINLQLAIARYDPFMDVPVSHTWPANSRHGIPTLSVDSAGRVPICRWGDSAYGTQHLPGLVHSGCQYFNAFLRSPIFIRFLYYYMCLMVVISCLLFFFYHLVHGGGVFAVGYIYLFFYVCMYSPNITRLLTA